MNFVVDQNENTGSYTSCILYFAYFTDATVSDCTFQKVQLGLTTATDYSAMDATVSDLIMTIPEGDTAYSGQYALLLTNLDDVKVSGCRIIGYDRGLNIGIIGDDPTASVTGCTFQNIQGKCAIQFGGTVGNGNVSFSGCNFNKCAVAASIHESAEGKDGSILSVGNSYSEIGTLLLYSVANNATSTVKFTSSSDNMESVTKQVATENAAVVAPEDGITKTESTWYSNDLTIMTEDDLLEFAQMVNSGNDFSKKTVTLGADITIRQSDWTPIGHGTRSGTAYTDDSTPFRGTFDGNNKTISDLTIKSTTGVEDPIGLFGIIDGGTVRGLTLENVSITVPSSQMAGSVAGMLCGGATVSGCTVGSGSTISVNNSAGGIVGKVYSNGTISNCINHADVITTPYDGESTSNSGNAGGIVGASYYLPTGTGLVIENCYNYGKITTNNGGYTGGIVGLSSAYISNCENNGTVIANGSAVGGIVGNQKNAGTITDCTNNGTVTNGNNDANIANYGTGGIVGWTVYRTDGHFTASDLTQIVITDCHNNANVTSNGTGAGGIVGMAYHGVTIENCDSGIDTESDTVTITGANMIAGILGGVQYDKHTAHVNGGCQIRVIGNTCAGTVADLGSSQNMAKLAGHIPATSSDDTCSPVHGSFTTVLDNVTTGMFGSDVDTTAGGDTVAYIEFDGVKYGYPTLQEAINVTNGQTIILMKDVKENITIPSGKTIILDLNTNMLQSPEGSNAHLITVESGANLNIRATGGGTVDCTVNGKACVNNLGTVTIEGGQFIRSNEQTDDHWIQEGETWTHTHYVIRNDGTMTITDGTFISGYENASVEGYYLGNVSSVITNGQTNTSGSAKLTINGGDFIGAANIVKNNSGVLTITDGTFTMDNRAHRWVGGNNIVENVSDSTMNITGGDFYAYGYGGAIDDDDWARHGIYNSGTANVSGITLTMEGQYSDGIVQSTSATGNMSLRDSTVTVDVNDPTSHAIVANDSASDRQLTISSGTYTGTVVASSPELLIVGGAYSHSGDISAFIDPSLEYEDDGSGNIVVTTPQIFSVGSMYALSEHFRLPLAVESTEGIQFYFPTGVRYDSGTGVVTISATAESEFTITASLSVNGYEEKLTVSNISGMVTAQDSEIELIVYSSGETDDIVWERLSQMSGFGKIVEMLSLDVSRVDDETEGVPFVIGVPNMFEGYEFTVVHFTDDGYDIPSFQISDGSITISPTSFSPFALVWYEPVTEPEPTPDPGWNPGWDDDDDYVPPIYVPSGSSSSDDDTVKIVACAAAAVVAAIMAAFLILGHRRE